MTVREVSLSKSITLDRRSVLMAGAAALVTAPAGAQAAWPARGVRVIVSYPAGGPSDGLSRLIAQGLSDRLGQTFTIDNRAGGNASIGTEIAARAEPDGYTITMGTQQNHATNQSLMPGLTHSDADFAAIAMVSTSSHVLIVHRDFEAKTWPAFRDLVRARAGAFNYASPGSGSASHLAMELLKTRAGLDIAHVPYRGAAPMMTDMIAGRVPMSVATVTSALQHIRNGVFVPLAIAGPARVPQLPEVATFAELGVSGVEADAWFGWFAPVRTPEPILDRLEREIVAIVEQSEVRTRIEGFGMQPALMRRAQFGPFVRAEVAKWAEVIRVSGAKLE